MRCCPRPLLALAVVLTLIAGAGCGERGDPGVERAVAAARKILADEEALVYDRLMAAGALKLEGDRTGEAALVEAMAGASRLERRAAMSNLLSTEDGRIIKIAMSESEPDFNFDLLEVLRTTPRRDASDFLRATLLDGTQRGIIQAIDAVAMGRHRELIAEVETQMESEDPRRRQFAIFAGASLGSEKAVAAALPLLRSRRSGEREAGAAALGFAGGKEAREALLGLREDPEPGVRIAAWASLSRYQHPEAAPRLVEALLSGDSRRAPLAAGALKRSRAEVIVAVADQVVGSATLHPLVEGRVFEAVGWARTVEAESVLRRGLDASRDEHVRLQTLWAVGWRGRAEELSIAEDRIEDPAVPIRAMAAWAYLYGRRGGAPPDTGLVAE